MAVKNTPARPSADDDADGTVENKIVDIQRRPGRSGLARAVPCHPPCGHESDEVHDPVPMHAQGPQSEYRTDRDGNGVYVGIGQHPATLKYRSPDRNRFSDTGSRGWPGARDGPAPGRPPPESADACRPILPLWQWHPA